MTSDPRLTRRRLLRLLRAAHAGERAAALAYRGHARSVRAPAEQAAIARIEAEEWAHRTRLGAMLREQGAAPARLRELIFHTIGRTLGALCQVSGWYLPMYGAGWIEAINVAEYQAAARLAADSAEPGYAAELLVMARCEREHEAYFRERVAQRWQTRLLGLWRAPGADPALALAPAASAAGRSYLPVADASGVAGAAGP